MSKPWSESAKEKSCLKNQRTCCTKLFKNPSSLSTQMITNDI